MSEAYLHAVSRSEKRDLLLAFLLLLFLLLLLFWKWVQGITIQTVTRAGMKCKPVCVALGLALVKDWVE